MHALCSRIVLFAFAIMLLISVKVEAQKTEVTIEGVVRDAETEKPLEDVNVYIAGSTIGTSTGGDGSYSLTVRVTGERTLVFSSIGFERQVYAVHLSRNSGKIINVELKPDTRMMEELVIVDSNKQWKMNFRYFRRVFLGYHPFADETKIENQWVLDFYRNKKNGQFVAVAGKPLILKNNALGYRIEVEIDRFHFKDIAEGSYKVYPRFEAMEASNRKEKAKWKRNRKRAYEGSPHHFFKSLYENKLDKNGFSIRSGGLFYLEPGETRYAMLTHSSGNQAYEGDYQGYRLKHRITIKYAVDENTSMKNFGASTAGVSTSYLQPNTDSGYFFLDRYGQQLNPNSLKMSGEWSDYRMALRLPFTYPAR